MNFINKFINKIRISIFKINNYDELIKEKLSSAIIYGLLLSIILGSLVGIYGSYQFRDTKNKFVSILEEDQNDFTLENGALTFENSPIKYEKGKFILYIDTNKVKSEIDSLRSILIHKDYSIAMLKDGVVIDVNGYKQEYTFTKNNTVFNNQELISSINRFGFVGNFIFIITIIQIFIGMIIDTLLLSVVVQVINRLEKIRISYKDILKICIYSITFTTIMNQIIYLNSLGFLISSFYVIMAMKSIRKTLM